MNINAKLSEGPSRLINTSNIVKFIRLATAAITLSIAGNGIKTCAQDKNSINQISQREDREDREDYDLNYITPECAEAILKTQRARLESLDDDSADDDSADGLFKTEHTICTTKPKFDPSAIILNTDRQSMGEMAVPAKTDKLWKSDICSCVVLQNTSFIVANNMLRTRQIENALQQTLPNGEVGEQDPDNRAIQEFEHENNVNLKELKDQAGTSNILLILWTIINSILFFKIRKLYK